MMSVLSAMPKSSTLSSSLPSISSCSTMPSGYRPMRVLPIAWCFRRVQTCMPGALYQTKKLVRRMRALNKVFSSRVKFLVHGFHALAGRRRSERSNVQLVSSPNATRAASNTGSGPWTIVDSRQAGARAPPPAKMQNTGSGKMKRNALVRSTVMIAALMACSSGITMSPG